jgi:hypothetical protein
VFILFGLLLQRQLTEHEYIEISYLFTIILSELAVKKITQLSKDAEWKVLMEQITHSKYNVHAALNEGLSEIHDEQIIHSKYNIHSTVQQQLHELADSLETNEEKLERIKKIQALAQYLEDVDTFFFALNKVEHSREKLQDMIEKDKVNYKLRDTLAIKSIPLCEMLEWQLTTISRAVETIAATEEGFADSVKAYLPEVKNQVRTQFVNVNLYACTVGIRIVFFDILKNAIKHVLVQKPELQITLYDLDINEIDEWLIQTGRLDLASVEYKVLAVTNNTPVCFENTDGEFEQRIYDHMLGKLSLQDTLSSTSQLGLRIINMITRYDGLGKSGHRWYFIPSNICLKGEITKMLLLIPKLDFYET